MPWVSCCWDDASLFLKGQPRPEVNATQADRKKYECLGEAKDDQLELQKLLQDQAKMAEHLSIQMSKKPLHNQLDVTDSLVEERAELECRLRIKEAECIEAKQLEASLAESIATAQKE